MYAIIIYWKDYYHLMLITEYLNLCFNNWWESDINNIEGFKIVNLNTTLFHLIHAIARAHASTPATSLMHVKVSTHHFCLWNVLLVSFYKKIQLGIAVN